ncbi:MAG: hypothetical protein ACXWLM_00340 [Myxococcales bacterium]
MVVTVTLLAGRALAAGLGRKVSVPVIEPVLAPGGPAEPDTPGFPVPPEQAARTSNAQDTIRDGSFITGLQVTNRLEAPNANHMPAENRSD